ncbi:hypothetical protein F511_29818 [Dorcoceras hygrometricum]|uniref:CCHC-type domain-containing protein n=1 Tax=Dorcoceras hygrometricum TaxID=472368 RepID=A0A2Z7AXU4_9LAMI|nr:hypothetical protein F511_29818 [Dorcoceras hygrometricum]
MPPRRGRSRRSAEGSRAPDSDEDVHRVDDVTRRIGSGSGGVFCGQCGGRHETSQCCGVRGLCHLCGQPGHFARACPSIGGRSSGQSQQGSAGGSSQRQQSFSQSQRSGFQPREPSRLLPESSGFLAGLVVAQYKVRIWFYSRVFNRLLPESSGFLAGLVVAQYKLSFVPWRLMHSTCILFLAVISVVLLLSVLGFDPMSLRGLVCFFVALFSGNPGSTAGRGFNPAGGAPGGV